MYLLIRYNAYWDSRENYGQTTLTIAAKKGHLAVVERLLQEKADVNAAPARDNGKTALQPVAADIAMVFVAIRLVGLQTVCEV